MNETLELEDEEEVRKVSRLLKWVGLFFAWPGVTIAGAFILFEDASDHVGHIFVSLVFGLVGVFLALLSRRIAEKYA